MAATASIERVKQNADLAKRTITELKNELNILTGEYNNMRAEQLREENIKLMQAVEEAKKKLVHLETSNGIKQISLPQVINSDNVLNCSEVSSGRHELKQTETPEQVGHDPKNKAKKDKKPKEKAAAVSTSEAPIDVGRLDLRVAKIVDVQRHPDADTLYVLQINCGEEKLRTVCSGLVKHIPMDELQDRTVMLLCNLKPVKMRGITSEAMVMCASSSDRVEVLLPPVNAVPGDIVECDGFKRQPDTVMNPKKKIFETVAPDLYTDDNLHACYKGVPFSVPGKGTFSSKTLKNVPVK